MPQPPLQLRPLDVTTTITGTATVRHSPPLRLRIILLIAVPPRFLELYLQGGNPGAKANASLLQDDSLPPLL
ncbi:hypothetical protein [Paenibacillus sp. J22TS3]|uniref:hypothetical protein n=1 Tax=Paenibacillus sp. J22TS3 TaxID=2807192 RepID=UPI001BCF8288|nr:hypothetical protein [Paenibacillus sp. J22TS3]